MTGSKDAACSAAVAAIALLAACSSRSVLDPPGGSLPPAADAGAADPGPAAPSREWALWPLVEEPGYLLNPEVATDTGTGLEWERAVPARTFTWPEAADHCAALAAQGLGGHADWRLPTAIELVSIFDVTGPGRWVDVQVFPHTPVDQLYWSSSTRAGGLLASEHWGARAATIAWLDAGERQQTRCLRGGALPSGPHYSTTAELVVDHWTGLTWQRSAPFAAKEWSGAQGYCAALALGTPAGGWRLPTYKELLSLVDRRASNPAWDAAFPSAAAVTFWSASAFADDGKLAWSVDFGSGVGSIALQAAAFGLRCVR